MDFLVFVPIWEPEQPLIVYFVAHDATGGDQGVEILRRLPARTLLDRLVVGEGEGGDLLGPVLKTAFTIRQSPERLE